LEAAHLQIVQTEKMASLGMLVAGVAHEINNPVSLIVGNVEPLRGRLERLRGMATVRDDEELGIAVARICELLDIIGRGAERTAGIVKDLRAFSGPSESRRQLVDLHECIEVTLRLLRPRWADRVVVHRNYGEVPPIDAVPGQINQILMNILANALDAISGSGNVWIATAVSEGSVTLTVRDDGCGIAQQHLDRVFDPFFTTKPMGKGTGLGLAISRGLIMHHGGSIAARSEPGGGAEFTIVLPLRPLACAS
jgi:signal transduction histidine kinase